jgi:hypothetical protein
MFSIPPESSAFFRGLDGQGKHRKQVYKFTPFLPLSGHLPTLDCYVEQFSIGDNGNRCLFWLPRVKSLEQGCRPLLPDVNANVRVQQKSGFHHKPLRFWDLSSLRFLSASRFTSSQKVKRSFYTNGLFAQDDFVAALFDLQFLAFKTELLR